MARPHAQTLTHAQHRASALRALSRSPVRVSRSNPGTVPLEQLGAKIPGAGAALAVDKLLRGAPLPLQIAAAPLFFGTGLAHAVADVLGGPSPEAMVQQLVQKLGPAAASAKLFAPAPGPTAGVLSTANAIRKLVGSLMP